MFCLIFFAHKQRPTFNTRGWTAAPGEVPLAGDDVRSTDVISRLALIGQHAAPHMGGVGRADPAKLNLGWGGAGVVRLHLCTVRTKAAQTCFSEIWFSVTGKCSLTYPDNGWGIPDSGWSWNLQGRSETEWWPLTLQWLSGSAPWTAGISRSRWTWGLVRQKWSARRCGEYLNFKSEKKKRFRFLWQTTSNVAPKTRGDRRITWHYNDAISFSLLFSMVLMPINYYLNIYNQQPMSYLQIINYFCWNRKIDFREK